MNLLNLTRRLPSKNTAFHRKSSSRPPMDIRSRLPHSACIVSLQRRPPAIPQEWVLGIVPAGFTVFGWREQLRFGPEASWAQGSDAPADRRERIKAEG